MPPLEHLIKENKNSGKVSENLKGKFVSVEEAVLPGGTTLAVGDEVRGATVEEIKVNNKTQEIKIILENKGNKRGFRLTSSEPKGKNMLTKWESNSKPPEVPFELEVPIKKDKSAKIEETKMAKTTMPKNSEKKPILKKAETEKKTAKTTATPNVETGADSKKGENKEEKNPTKEILTLTLSNNIDKEKISTGSKFTLETKGNKKKKGYSENYTVVGTETNPRGELLILSKKDPKDKKEEPYKLTPKRFEEIFNNKFSDNDKMITLPVSEERLKKIREEKDKEKKEEELKLKNKINTALTKGTSAPSKPATTIDKTKTSRTQETPGVKISNEIARNREKITGYKERIQKINKDGKSLGLTDKEIENQILVLEENIHNAENEIGKLETPNVSPKPTTTIDKGPNSQEAKRVYWEFINKAAKIISQKGIDRIVIHGDEFKMPPNPKAKEQGQEEKKEYEDKQKKEWLDTKYEKEDFDLDLKGSMLLLNNMAEGKKKVLNDRLFIEKIPKGSEKMEYPVRDKEVILYIDVGGKNPSIGTEKEVTKIYADHHGTEGGYTTSATQIVKDIADAGKFSLGDKKTSEYLEKMASFVAKFDNLTYLNDKLDDRNPKGPNLVDKTYLIKTFSRSLYSLAKFLPFETVLEILGKSEKFLKNGKPRNWEDTFTPYEINNEEIGKIIVDYKKSNGEIEKITVKELVERNEKQIKNTIYHEEMAVEKMNEHGINIKSPLIGKTVFQNFSKIEVEVTDKDGKKTKAQKPNIIPQNIAYLIARGLGNDSFVSYNPRDGVIYINSNGKFDLMPIWKKLNEIIPGYPKPVRNAMMFPPKDPEMMKKMKDISEEKLLEILGMKGDKYVAVENREKEETSAEWTTEDEKVLNNLLATIESTKKRMEESRIRREKIVAELEKFAD